MASFSTWVQKGFTPVWKRAGTHNKRGKNRCGFDINYNTKTRSGQVFNIRFSDELIRFFTVFHTLGQKNEKWKTFAEAKLKISDYR